MRKWDINCADCGNFILTEAEEREGGDVTCIAGSYENGYYDGVKDVFYCKECAKRRGLKIDG